MKVKALLKGVGKNWTVRQSYWEHMDKGIPETRPSSHSYAPYFSSRAESFHNQRHRSLGIDGASSSREHTSFWNGHKMFIAWTVRPRIPQLTLHGQRCMQEMLSTSFFRRNNTRWKRLPCLLSAKQWLNVSKNSRWLYVRQQMGGAP